jgi:hypothetical protein
MSCYCLAPGVHLRASAEGAVLLDVQKDAFVGLDALQAEALSLLLCAHSEVLPSPEHRALAESMHARGLLTLQRASCNRSAEPSIVEVTRELLPWHRMRGGCVRPHHVLTFARAWRTASALTHPGRFASAVDRVRTRAHDRGAVFDLKTARHLLSAYYHLRAFAFGKAGRCLLDSLTLLEFLAAYELYPTWVIGVQIRPFASHSWVQYQHYVLNGTANYVRAYTPILVV